MTTDLMLPQPDLVIPNLAMLGLARRGNGRTPDLTTIWVTPFPVLKRYEKMCRLLNIEPYAGGTWEEQGPSDQRGYITSGYRDQAIAGNVTSPHMHAIAIDVAIGDVNQQLAVAPVATSMFNRMGLYPEQGFIHLDQAPETWMKRYGKARWWAKRSGTYQTFPTYQDLVTAVHNWYV